MVTALEDIQKLPCMEFAPGGVVVEQGGKGGPIYFLAKGKVEVVKDGVLIVEVSNEGAVFGEMSVLLDIPATATVRAIEPSFLYVIADPNEFLKDHPEASLYVARILARRLDSLNRYLIDVKSQFKDHKDHMNLVDEVLDSLMLKHPRVIERRDQEVFD